MKLKVLLLVLLSIFLFALLIVGHPLMFSEREAKGLDAEKERDLVVILEPDEFSPEGLKAVKSFISGVKEKLSSFSGPLKGEIIKKIGQFYGDQGILTTHTGDTLKGGTEISKYFERLRGKKNMINVEFKLKCVHVKELTHILNLPKEKKTDDDVVHVAYLIISYSFDLDGMRIDPGSVTNRRHIRVCDWGH